MVTGRQQRFDGVEAMLSVDLDVHDDAAVDLARRRHQGDDVDELLGRDPAAEVDGIGRRHCRWGTLGDRLAAARRQDAHDEATGAGGVGTEEQGPAAVADQGDPRPGGGRLAVEEQSDVDQLLQRSGPQYSGVGEQGVDRRLVVGEGGSE